MAHSGPETAPDFGLDKTEGVDLKASLSKETAEDAVAQETGEKLKNAAKVVEAKAE